MIRTVELAGPLTGSWQHRILRFAVGGPLLLAGALVLAQAPKADDAKAADANAAEARPVEANANDQGDDDAEWIVTLGNSDREARDRLQKYRAIVNQGRVSSEEDRKLIGEVIRYKLAQLTLKKNREAPPAPPAAAAPPPPALPPMPGMAATAPPPPPPPPAPARPGRDWTPLHDIRADIVKDVKLAGSLGGGKDARPELLKAILKEVPAIIEGYHFSARLNCAILLWELNSEERPETPFIDAHQLMIKIARDTKQIDAVRVWGVRGCTRLLQFNQTPAPIRVTIVKALTELLREQNKASKEEKAAHDWLTFRIVDGLGYSNTIQIDRKPEVVEVLAQVIVDTEHPYRPRYYAAQSIGRLPMDGSINLSMISTEIVRLAQQVAIEYSKSKEDPKWKIAAWRVYFAFRPETDQDKAMQAGLKNQVDSKGSLASAKKPVTDAYEAILPIVNDVLASRDVPAPAMEKLNKWLLDNTPKDFKVYPNANPLTLPPNHATRVAANPR